jgi:hypothetical protein
MAEQERRKTLKDEECENERQEVRVMSSAAKPLVLPIQFDSQQNMVLYLQRPNVSTQLVRATGTRRQH